MATPTSYTPKRLVDPAQLTASSTILYTSPGGGLGSQITALKLINTGSSAVQVTITIVKSGGADDATTALCYNFSLPADGVPYELLTSQQAFYLNANDAIKGVATTAAVITYHINGVELA